MATECLIKFPSQNYVFNQISESFLSINERHTHVMPSKIFYDGLYCFPASIIQGRSKICHKSICAQTVISGYIKAEVLYAGTCTTILQIIE